MVTGVDLVHLQLRVASGEPLGLYAGCHSPARARHRGGASAKTPRTPSPLAGNRAGVGSTSPAPCAHRQRIVAGNTITHHYDPMIAKLIAWGENREQAIGDDSCAGAHCRAGRAHQSGFLIALLRHPPFRKANCTRGLLEEYPLTGELEELPLPVMAALGLAETLLRPRTQARPCRMAPPSPTTWQTLGAWQIGGE